MKMTKISCGLSLAPSSHLFVNFTWILIIATEIAWKTANFHWTPLILWLTFVARVVANSIFIFMYRKRN